MIPFAAKERDYTTASIILNTIVVPTQQLLWKLVYFLFQVVNARPKRGFSGNLCLFWSISGDIKYNMETKSSNFAWTAMKKLLRHSIAERCRLVTSKFVLPKLLQ